MGSYTNDDIQKELENVIRKVVKVTARKHKDGLLSGIRVVTVPKTLLERNPLPSYITVKGNKLYVTYAGQTVTCRYRGKAGHVQSDCTKKLEDFPQLGNHRTQNSSENTVNLTMNRSDSTSSCANEPINLSKRKQTFSHSNLFLFSKPHKCSLGFLC